MTTQHSTGTSYPLGTDDAELARLRFQHDVWGPVTRAFLDRVGVRAGMRVLDLGCGPGFVSFELVERVGVGGEVVALDESERWIEHVRGETARRATPGPTAVRARMQSVPADLGTFDVVFARWSFSFLPDPIVVARDLAARLRPGGVLAIQDYNHEGVSIFPPSEGFRAVVRGTREMYRRAGGDVWVAGRAAAIFAAAGLELLDLHANVSCGGPQSDAFRWADLFFPHFSRVMEAQGLVTPAERELFVREWEERRRDPTSLFFSPIVVDAAARKRA